MSALPHYPSQMHSLDCRVRLKSDPLVSITFEHLFTIQDLSILTDSALACRSPISAGLTEWQARVDGRLVSLGWDWVRLQDGCLLIDDTVPPRTNLLLVDARGYDSPTHDLTAVLWQLIRSLDWQRAANEAQAEAG